MSCIKAAISISSLSCLVKRGMRAASLESTDHTEKAWSHKGSPVLLAINPNCGCNIALTLSKDKTGLYFIK